MCLHHFVEQQMRRTPERLAIASDDERLTYRELERRASHIAYLLAGHGIGRGHRVGVFLDRSVSLVATLLGVLETGAAYVPMDLGHPAARLAHILEDAQVSLIVTDESVTGDLPGGTIPRLLLPQGAAAWGPEPDNGPPAARVLSSDLAYILFTSGSTGRPKGVALEHGSAAAFVRWATRVFSADMLAGVLFSTSIGFDLSVFELFATLAAGGTVYVAKNVLHLPTLQARDQVTLLNTVPSGVAELLRAGTLPPSIKTVTLCGEVLRPALVEAIYANAQVERVYNLYGPTEATTYATGTLVRRGAPVTIGRAIETCQVYVLDARAQPVPVGVAGELYLAGVALARGYARRPALTSERFVANPYGGKPGARMYRTGDRVRWTADGVLEFLGRVDHQVKIRGFRVEPEEVERVLASHPAVRQAAVAVRDDAAGLPRLVAYVVGDISAADLRGYLRRSLPDYMIPEVFVPLMALPRNAAGKIDRPALPAPHTEPAAATYVAPRTPAEETLAAIWSDVLDRERVGVEDNFFDLGGHSLVIMKITARLQNVFGVDLGIRELFDAPTIAQVAALVEARLAAPLELRGSAATINK